MPCIPSSTPAALRCSLHRAKSLKRTVMLSAPLPRLAICAMHCWRTRASKRSTGQKRSCMRHACPTSCAAKGVPLHGRYSKTASQSSATYMSGDARATTEFQPKNARRDNILFEEDAAHAAMPQEAAPPSATQQAPRRNPPRNRQQPEDPYAKYLRGLPHGSNVNFHL